jgi:hypothetical protein
MSNPWEDEADGVKLVRLCVRGARVLRVVRSEENEIVLEFDNGAVLAISGGVGVDYPVVGAATVGDLGEWGLV